MHKALSSSCAADGVRKIPGPLRNQQSMDWTLLVCACTDSDHKTHRGGSELGCSCSLAGVLGWTHHCLFKAKVAGRGNSQGQDSPQHSLHYCSHCQTWVSSSLFAELLLASLLCRYFNYADMFLDSFKYVYYLLIRP